MGYPHNAVALVGVYAAILRELGQPLHFPGTEVGFHLLHGTVDVRLLCRAVEWIARTPRCANQDYNVGNGDVFSWSDAWDAIASFFSMRVGDVQTQCLAESMAGLESVWERIATRYGLREPRLAALVDWSYGDHLFNKVRSDIPSMIKLWHSGFHETMDSRASILDHLRGFRELRAIP